MGCAQSFVSNSMVAVEGSIKSGARTSMSGTVGRSSGRSSSNIPPIELLDLQKLNPVTDRTEKDSPQPSPSNSYRVAVSQVLQNLLIPITISTSSSFSAPVSDVSGNVTPPSRSIRKPQPMVHGVLELSIKRKIHDITMYMMPFYFVDNAKLSDCDKANLKSSWSFICDDRSPVYMTMKAEETTDDFPYSSCLMWFLATYFDRLFDVLPAATEIFKDNIILQGHTLMEFVLLCVDHAGDPKIELYRKLGRVYHKSANAGFLSSHYPVCFDCILWTLEHCLGKEVFSEFTSLSWKKSISRILYYIVSLSVREDVLTKERRFESKNGSDFSI